MQPPRRHLLSLIRDDLLEWSLKHKLPRFRSDQILKWVYEHRVTDFSSMTNLALRDRELLGREFFLRDSAIVADRLATDGTRKLLLQWSSTESIRNTQNVALTVSNPSLQTECVMIPTNTRRTACISSQVGCPVGCRFCASGMGGLDASLETGMIVEQVIRLSEVTGERISNVVFMGMGEPLTNISAVMQAARILAAPWGLGISARKITISTVGIPRAIHRLADELNLPVTLALSLHAPDDKLRRELIPWAEFTTIADLLDACSYYFEKTGREITLEYTLLGGVNDHPAQARDLARLAKTLRSNINIIRYNEVPDLPFRRPASENVLEFQRILTAAGIKAHIRASRGRDIAAACGQLRREHSDAKG